MELEGLVPKTTSAKLGKQVDRLMAPVGGWGVFSGRGKHFIPEVAISSPVNLRFGKR